MSTVFRSAEEVSDIQKSSASLSSVMYHSSFAFSTIKPHWSSVSGVVLRGSPNCNPNPLVPGLCMCWYLLNCFSLTAQLAKNPPAIWEAPVQFLGWKDSPGEGIGDPLQCSCLENPRDGGAWWAAVYEVTQSRTRLKQLSSSIHTHISPLL